MLTDEEKAELEKVYRQKVEATDGGPTLRVPLAFAFRPYIPRASQSKRRKQGRR